MESKNLVSVRKAHEMTGASIGFFKQLLRKGKLKRYKVGASTYISMVEWEQLAKETAEPDPRKKRHYKVAAPSIKTQSV